MYSDTKQLEMSIALTVTKQTVKRKQQNERTE